MTTELKYSMYLRIIVGTEHCNEEQTVCEISGSHGGEYEV
jgi:hypothetical protein